jgi:DNA invertase Pin-like site-specific DNA recombinase
MKGQRIGYVRVSTTDQNTDRQLEGQTLDKIFTDKASGSTTQRPALQEALAYVRQGDVLVVHSLDRLARNLGDLRSLVENLTKRGVRVDFMKENLTFNGDDNAMSKLMLNMLGAIAEYERSLIRSRQAEGICAAKLKGVYKGRKHKLSADSVAALRQRIASGEKKAEVARSLNISRETLYAYLRQPTAA